MNDLHRFDIATLLWEELTPASTQGITWPVVRGGHGFAALGSRIYLFGGAADDGTCCGMQYEALLRFGAEAYVVLLAGLRLRSSFPSALTLGAQGTLWMCHALLPLMTCMNSTSHPACGAP